MLEVTEALMCSLLLLLRKGPKIILIEGAHMSSTSLQKLLCLVYNWDLSQEESEVSAVSIQVTALFLPCAITVIIN